MTYTPTDQPVAAVCGNEVLVYGVPNASGVRPLKRVIEFPHRGAALLWAQEHDEDTKPKPQKRRY